MRFIPPIELDRRSIADLGHDRGSTVHVDRLIELSSWMMVLGTIRLTCALADYAGAFLEAWRGQPITFQMLSSFTQEIQPVIALCAAWPLLLCIALRRTRWPELLPAAAATFLILSIGGLIDLSAGWIQARQGGATIGSFHLTRRAFIHPTLSDVSLGILGATQLLLELTTAARAILLVPRSRGMHAAESGKNDGARRARFGRLAVYTSIGFLVLTVRLTIWSTYVELLNNSAIIREFVLRNDFAQIRGPHNVVHLSKEEKRLLDMRIMLMTANDAASTNHFLTAEETYLKLISLADSEPQDLWLEGDRVTVAQALNGLAWLQATCPETARRNSAQAIRHARRAIELEPNDGNIWNTLGAAYYRAGQWNEAKVALSRSMQLRNQGDSFDWFFLALVELKLGHRELALGWYERAVGWFHQSLPNDRELYRFQVEATQELELPKPTPPPPAPSTNRKPSALLPIGSSPLRRRMRSTIADQLPRPDSP